MEFTSNVVTGSPAVHNHDTADCACCGLAMKGHSPGKVYKKRIPSDCPNALPQLALAPRLIFQRRATTLPATAKVPRGAFAERILGLKAEAFWAKVKAHTLSEITKRLIASIVSITRDGAHVHVVYNIGPLGARWEATAIRRELRAKHPEVLFHSEQADLARQLHGHMPQEYFRPRPRRQRRVRKQKPVM